MRQVRQRTSGTVNRFDLSHAGVGSRLDITHHGISEAVDVDGGRGSDLVFISHVRVVAHLDITQEALK